MLINIFSKRQKKGRGELPDVYVYNDIPKPLRVQIVFIFHGVLGGEQQYNEWQFGTSNAYKAVVESLCREYGQFQLVELNRHRERNYLEEMTNFILQEQNHERVLDAVEVAFRTANAFARSWEYMHHQAASENVDNAITEFNARFQEHAIGFRLEEGEIVRIDSELVHAEVVKPALQLLRDKEYEGAQAEFLKAHEHYRHGKTKDVLSECLKSLESVMKTVCKRRKWSVPSNATSASLIQALFDNGLIPAFWASHFTGLRAMLEGGVPTARNRLGAHGQGSEVIEIPEHIAGYVLHQTAAAIVFIDQAEKSLQ
jgi:hypothetical protein